MLPRRIIERYLRFLLRRRVPVSIAIAVGTVFFVWLTLPRLTIFTNFFDLYPPRHPYIELYTKYRAMFGTANTLVIVLEAKHGTIFDSPETIAKVHRITLGLLHDVPGVNGEQVISITHPKLKTTLTSGTGIKIVPLMYPRLPQNADDLRFLRQKVYTTEGVRGFFVSPDDKATLISAGFWEEYFDLNTMWQKIQEIVTREQADGTVTIYVAGPPVLYAYFNEAVAKMAYVFLATGLAMVGLLWFYFRSVQGVVIPVFSGLMSAIWGLGFAGLCGFTLDPLVLVVFVLITARALSHSVQSMERYHEEYHLCHDREAAILRSYVGLFSPAMVSIIADGLAILTIAVASIPLMQKLAFVACFWIVSIFLSVVTLHPIILASVRPPRERATRQRGSDRVYNGVTRGLIALATGRRRRVVLIVFAAVMAFGLYFAHQLKIGDTNIGEALLYHDHPYNQAMAKLSENFVGASQLVIIAEGKKPGAVNDPRTLSNLDLFARHMTQTEGVGGALTAATLLKKIYRTFHEGDPKWEMLPTRSDHVGQLFYILSAGTSRGEMDRFFSPDYTNATVTIFYKNYNNEIIHDAIQRAKAYIAAS